MIDLNRHFGNLPLGDYMPSTYACIVAGLTYWLLYKLLFEGWDDFVQNLKWTLLLYPLGAIFDYFTNWSPTFEKVSVRILLWIPSGSVSGYIVYSIISTR